MGRPTNGEASAASAQGPEDPRLAEVVEEYRAALQAGRRPDRQGLCARYPDLAGALAECLDAVEFMHGAAREAGPSDAPPAGPAVPADVRPGEPVGDFRILREVGRGGMGVVYEAEQVSLRRRVALKVLPFAAVLDPRQLQRFQNEAQAAACLHHPNIVPVYAVGHDRGVHFYAMQLIDGQTLAALIRGLRRQARKAAEGPGSLTEDVRAITASGVPTYVSAPAGGAAQARQAAAVETKKAVATERSVQRPAYFRTVARLGVQAAEALDYAHQQGIVHRDVKPANLLVDGRGNLWVTDFGLAQLQGNPGVTATGDLVGTLRYMSPEQALGRRYFVDQRTDVYSLGVTLYELLTLHPALPGLDRQELLRRLEQEEPTALRRLNPAVPAELETIVTKAMAKNPEERYATAQELADDLRRYLEDKPILARPPGPVLKLRKWVRRRQPLVVSVALSLALLLAVFVCGMTVYGIKMGQLADDERALQQAKTKALLVAERRLHKALLDEATYLRLARQPGYRRKMWDNLQDAATQPIPAKDKNFAAIRAEVLASLGDPIGLDPVPPARVARRPAERLPPAFEHIVPGDVPGTGRVMAVSADGKFLALPGYGAPGGDHHVDPHWVHVLDKAGNLHGRDRSPLGAIFDLKFSPTSPFLVAACEQGVATWTLIRGMPLRSFFWAGNVISVDVHPDGRLLATGGRRIELWSLVANRLIASFPSPRQGARVEFSEDGKYLLAVGPREVFAAWPVRDTPEKISLEGHQDGVPGVAFSPDGRLLATVSKDRVVRLWDAATGKLLRRCLALHPGPIEAAAFSPDGRWLATGDLAGVVILWDPRSGAEVTRVGSPALPPGSIWRLQFSATGFRLAAAGQRGVAVWSVTENNGKVSLSPWLHTNAPNRTLLATDLALHPAGQDLVFQDGIGRVWRRKLVLARQDEVELMEFQARPGTLRGLHFDRSGRWLTFIDPGGKLGVLDWQKGGSRLTDQPAYHLALDASGRWAATARPDQDVVIYDLKENRPVLTLPSQGSEIWSLAWSPDGARLAVSLSDGGAAIWDLEQVRTQLRRFGIASPSTVSRRPNRPASP
jgi:serine/threonine protein kinase/WD40 repeat protein